MPKQVGRKVLEGKIMPKEHKSDGDTQGIPSGVRGSKNDNSGKSIRDFRVGRGSI